MATPGTSGYSGTSFAKKLGINAASIVMLSNPPADYENLLAPLPRGCVDVIQYRQDPCKCLTNPTDSGSREY